MTDVVDIEGMFRLIESIHSKKAEPVKLWLAKLGKERIDELKNKGINKAQEFATLTNILTKVWSGYTVKEYKEHKNLKKENLRDNITNIEKETGKKIVISSNNKNIKRLGKS